MQHSTALKVLGLKGAVKMFQDIPSGQLISGWYQTKGREEAGPIPERPGEENAR